MPAVTSRFTKWLESRWAPHVILGVTLAIALPSLQLGFSSDDHALRASVDGRLPEGPPFWDLYRFVPGTEAGNLRAIEGGTLPWWTSTELKLHLVRPLASALFTAERHVFGDSPIGCHLVSIALYLALVAIVGAILASVLPRATARLAMLLFGMSTAHFFPFGWIACQHALVAAVPSMAGFAAFLRDDSPGRTRGRWWLAGGLAVGLLGGEMAVGVVAFPFAYAWLGRDENAGRGRARWAPLVPAGAVCVAYAILYVLVHGGAAHSGGYVDPLSAPARFALVAATRLPIYAANALLGAPAELATIMAPAPLVAVGVVAIALVFVLAKACAPAMSEQERTALPWLVCGAILAVLPGAGGFPGARLLLVPNLGVMALVAVSIRYGLRGRMASKALAGFLLLVHMVMAPALCVFNAGYNAGLARSVEGAARTAELVPPRAGDARPPRVFVIGASDPMIVMYVPAFMLATDDRRLSCWSVLSGARTAHRVTRAGEAEIVITPDAPMLSGPFETLYRLPTEPLRVGDAVGQCGATYRVMKMSGERPTEVRVKFDVPLEDESVRILAWKDGRLRHLVPPPIGESVDVPWSVGPLGMF